MREVAEYADALGPDKGILAVARSGQIAFTTNFVSR